MHEVGAPQLLLADHESLASLPWSSTGHRQAQPEMVAARRHHTVSLTAEPAVSGQAATRQSVVELSCHHISGLETDESAIRLSRSGTTC